MIEQYCTTCGKRLNSKMKATFCKGCVCRANAAKRARPPKLCVDCGNPVSRRDVTRCTKCHAEYMKINPPSIGTKPMEKSPSWKGGRSIDKRGYVYIKNPTHPNANARGYVFEHRLIMEETIGRILNRGEIVHHLNGDKADNRPANLRLMSSNKEHVSTFHKPKRKPIQCPKTGRFIG